MTRARLSRGLAPKGRRLDCLAGYDVIFYLPSLAALLAPDTGFRPGGAEVQVRLLARILAARGRRVGVVAYRLPGLPDAFDGVDVIPRQPPHRGSPMAKLRELAAIWGTVAHAPTRAVVQRTASFETGLVALGVKLRRRRFVYSVANDGDFDFGSRERRRNAWLFHLGVRIADDVVVQTAEQAELCIEKFGREPTLIRSLVEPAAPRTETPQAFLWVGRLASHKRPLAFLKLARAFPRADFRMVAVPAIDSGGRELAARVEREAEELTNLTLLFTQPRADLVRLLESAVAVVNTSEYEGMPNVFLEGWARGVPALALDIDPDGVIERERLGGFARGAFPLLVELARRMWEERSNQSAVSRRCRAYIAREHSLEPAAERWEHLLGLADA